MPDWKPIAEANCNHLLKRVLLLPFALWLGRRLANAWVDLQPVAAAARPEVKARSLDEWLDHFGIECAVRHQAAADTLATAELLQVLWPAVRAQAPGADFGALQHLAAQGRWLQR